MATPVLRKEASIASTRIYRNVKIDCRAFNTESSCAVMRFARVRFIDGAEGEIAPVAMLVVEVE
jgi:hypothetical protein